MTCTGQVLGTALAVSERMVWQLSELEKMETDCQRFKQGMVDLNGVLREIVSNYCQTYSDGKIHRLENVLQTLWEEVGTLYPQLILGRDSTADLWREYICQLEELTSLQMLLSSEAEYAEDKLTKRKVNVKSNQ